jgi:hypothetical protein
MMESHPSVSTEHRVMNISIGALEFPSTETHEKVKELSHINLMFSQLPMNVLHNLQSSVTQEIQLHAESTTMKLDNVSKHIATLHAKYSRLVKEREHDKHRA